ncbi:HWE histidine kinase domain-containing protein [Marinibaculum pumilum]|uniref:histidine kinase n=1 Tax=Marinibaculum pumilum TaxID=1766165 RepID=A0ABV7L3Q3_9PROT
MPTTNLDSPETAVLGGKPRSDAGRRRWRRLLQRPGRERPISLHLLILGAAAALPAIIFAGYLVFRFDGAQRQATEAIAASTARSVSSGIDRAVEGMMITLRVLASANALQEADYEAFHARTHAALRGSGTYFILVDDAYQQLLNTRVPYGTPLPHTADPESATEALRTGGLVVSDLFFGTVSQSFVFNVVSPLELADNRRYALILTKNASDLQALIDEQRLAEGWSISLTDRSGQLVAGSGEGSIGEIEKFTQGLSDLDGGGGPTYVTRDGERYLVSVETVPLSRWRVTVWASESVVEQPLRESLQLLILAGLLILGATFILSLWYGRHIAAPIRRLMRNARALGQGERVASFESPVREANEVADALAAASRQRAAAEERIHLLMRELSHRAKNQLAVVSAMARQTSANAESLADFAPTFNERVQALARSTSLLGEQNWQAAGLRQLIATQLAPFDGEDLPRIALDGPDLELSADAAQNLGLALHEMATNASKYGALSREDGRIGVTWRLRDEAGERRLEFVWAERGGPKVSPPSRSGFGTVVIERLAAQSLKAKVETDFDPAGVTWRLDMPADLLQPDRGLFG